MVSSLSARLLAGVASSGYNSSGTSSESDSTGKQQHQPQQQPATKKPRKHRIPPYARMPGSVGGSSGYSADLEQQQRQQQKPTKKSKSSSPLPPTSIDLISRENKRPVAPSDSSSSPSPTKRSKKSAAEVQYMACSAKDDLARGGLRAPELHVHRPRAFPPRSGVDMSTVTLKHAADFQSSPFLSGHKYLYTANEIPSILTNMVREFSVLYADSSKDASLPAHLARVVSKLAAANTVNTTEQTTSGDDSDSTTSSFTNSEDMQENNSSSGSDNKSRPNNATVTNCAPKSDLISIGEALSISCHPRIITLATAPYPVVQVNAAFHRMVGTSDFLGKPLTDLTKEGNSSAILEEALFETIQTSKKLERSRVNFQDKQDQAQSVVIVPVGPSTDQITHVAIELRQTSSSSEQPPMAPPSPAVAMNVMG